MISNEQKKRTPLKSTESKRRTKTYHSNARALHKAYITPTAKRKDVNKKKEREIKK